MANEHVQDSTFRRFSDECLERALLGLIFLEREIPETLRFLKPGDFYNSLNRAIYSAMCTLQARGDAADFSLVMDQMRHDKTLKDLDLVGGMWYFNECLDAHPTLGMEKAYARRIVDLAGKRRVWTQTLLFVRDMSSGELDDLPAKELRERQVALLGKLRLAPPAPPCATWVNIQSLIGPILWDWPGWLPRGFLTILAGEAGLGKSLLALRLCACYLRGDDWPDGAPFCDRTLLGGGVQPHGDAPLHDAATPDGGLPRERDALRQAAPPRQAAAPPKAAPPHQAEAHRLGEAPQVLWCEAEAAQVLNWERAKSWGLPLDRILAPLGALEDVSLDNATHREAISNLAHRPEVRLVVVDSFSGASRRDENSSESLAAVRWLAALARDTGKPILLLHHLRKRGLLDGDRKVSLERLRGHSSIVQPARLVLAMDAPDPNRGEYKRLSVIKSNLAPFPEPLGFQVTERGDIRFGEAPQAPQALTVLDRAVEALKDMLQGGPVPAEEAMDDLQELGLSEKTIRRAKTKLGIRSGQGA